MKKTKLKERIDLLCRDILREAAEHVGKPTNPVVDDFTEIVDPAANLTDYPQKGNVTYQETLAAGETFKKLLSYMSMRAENADEDEIEQTVDDLIVNASKIYAHIKLNKKPRG